LERLLNIKEAAEFLNVSEMTVRRWTDNGSLRCYRVGGRRARRFKPQDLMAYLEGKGLAYRRSPRVGRSLQSITVSHGHVNFLSIRAWQLHGQRGHDGHREPQSQHLPRCTQAESLSPRVSRRRFAYLMNFNLVTIPATVKTLAAGTWFYFTSISKRIRAKAWVSAISPNGHRWWFAALKA